MSDIESIPERAGGGDEHDILSPEELRFLSLATLIGPKRSMALLRHAFGSSSLRSAMPSGRSPRLAVDDDRIWVFVETVKKVKNLDLRSACRFITKCGGFPVRHDGPLGRVIEFLKNPETLRRRHAFVAKDERRRTVLEFYVNRHIEYWKVSGLSFDLWCKRQLRSRPRGPIIPGGDESQSDGLLLVLNHHIAFEPRW